MTEDLKNPDPPHKYGKTRAPKLASSGYSGPLLFNVILDAPLAVWVGGIALHRGFGISVPFVPVLLLLAVFMVMVYSLVSIASGAHQAQCIKAAPHIAAADVMGEYSAERALESAGFAEAIRKIQEAGK